MAKIQIRRDIASNWSSANPVLSEGELAYATDTKIIKIGDGTNNYNNICTIAKPDLIDLSNLSVTSATASGNGNLSYNNTNGQFTFTPADLTSIDISSKIGYTDLQVCCTSPSGQGCLLYNNTNGDFTFTPADLTSIDISSKIGYTDLQVCCTSPSGQGCLLYNNTNGDFTFTPADLSGLPTSGALANFICLVDLSVTSASASGTGSLVYCNTTGVFNYTPPDIAGCIGNLTTTNIPEGTNLYYTDTRADTRATLRVTAANIGNLNNVDETGVANGKILKYNSTSSKWEIADDAGGISHLHEDSSPELGGDLDTAGFNITFGNNEKAKFGTACDMEIYHSGSNSYIDDVGTGSIYIRSGTTYFQNATGTKTSIQTNSGAGQTLYYNNTDTFNTTSDGIQVCCNIKLISTETGSSTGPGIVLFRNNCNPANGDYIGEIQFHGSTNYLTQEAYARIAGKITDTSFSNPSGLIETTVKAAGGFKIVSRQTGDQLQLLNGVGLSVDGSVGIGTTCPGYKLDVAGTINACQIYVNGSALTTSSSIPIKNDSGVDQFTSTTSSGLRFGGSGATSVSFQAASNQVTINSTNTTYTAGSGLDLNGTAFSVETDLRDSLSYVGYDTNTYIYFNHPSHIDFYVNNFNRARLESDGDFHADGDIIAYSTTISDIRLKENITKIKYPLEKIKQLKGVTFLRKDNNKTAAGLIAQDVEKVLPEAVRNKKLPLKFPNSDTVYKTLEYDAVIGLLVESIKELKHELDLLKNGNR